MEHKRKGTKDSCFCDNCQAACRHKPGWFLPGEVERVAEYLEISLPELFQTKIAVDWWVEEHDIFVLLPALDNEEAGEEFPADPRGICIFFKDGLCEIHPVKPFECREMIHDQLNQGRHKQVADAWRSHQNQIIELLGREPISLE